MIILINDLILSLRHGIEKVLLYADDAKNFPPINTPVVDLGYCFQRDIGL